MSSDARPIIDQALVARLIASQFPQWADLPVRPVEFGGWDNRTFHLGERMVARLPSRATYAAQVEKEQCWLPQLAVSLPLPIPRPLARGRPAQDYPWPWSIYEWLDGQAASHEPIPDKRRFAEDLADFLLALQRADASGGPAAGPHSFFRGGPLSTYDADTRLAVAKLGALIDAAAVLAVWDAALAAVWTGAPVWVHGDVAPGNLLVVDGRLSAVIDFGCSAVGDPACDLAIAWTFFEAADREAFRARLGLDAGAWARGRGWALWKALIAWAVRPGANPLGAEASQRVVEDLVAEHRAIV